ncbi:MAG: glycosyltransferase [Candidatus Margulisbacteria bacterium]|nr:glycosyltransferase [Candidatus Margulisiibacteriota bacterium]
MTTIPVLNYAVTHTTLPDLLLTLPTILAEPKFHTLITLNPQIIMAAEKDPSISNLLHASILIPDSVGILWAAKKKLTQIPGVELTDAILKSSLTCYLIGSQPTVLKKLLSQIQAPIFGSHHGYFNDEELTKIIQDIQTKKPDIILVALGVPKQEHVLIQLTKTLTYGIGIGVGGSFDVISGTKKRAPTWVISLHLEWLYRGLSEPKRLKTWGYLIQFIFKVLSAA